MRYGLDDFHAVDKDGYLNAGSLQDVLNAPLNLAGHDFTVADGVSDITYNGSLDGSASVGQVFAVTLTAGVTYSFAERPTATDGIEDAFLRLYGPTGSQITYDDDGGAGRSSLLTYTPTTSGTYYLAAGSWVNEFSSGGDVGHFTLDQWSSNDPDAPGTMAGALQIQANSVTFGQTSSTSDVDMYKIDVSQGLFYTFGYSGGYDGAGETGSVARVDLLDSAGHVIATNLAGESGVSFLAPDDATYYVRLTPYSTLKGGYTLDASEVDPATKDPLDAIRWKSAGNAPSHDVDGVDTIYVYFAPAGENFGQTADDGVTPMTTYGWQQYQVDGVMNALTTNYTPITGIHYVQTTDENIATFKLLTTNSTQYGAYFDPQDPAYGSSQGVGVFNLLSGGFGTPGLESTMDRGGYSYAVVLHEFGHAHGLAHPHDNGGGSDVMLGVTGSQGSYGIYNLNQGVYTVMSYNDGWPLDPDGAQPFTRATIGYGWSGSLSAFDIAALQERYGVHDSHTGNDVYTIATVDGPGAFYSTIWDTGGHDTIAYNGSADAQIDLLAATLDYSPTGGGAISYAGGVHAGFTIAHGVVIEDATGGSGNDALLGNSAANMLSGNDGNDTLMGRAGDDLLLGGAGDDIIYGGDGVDVATLGGGNDIFIAEVGASKLNLKGPQKGSMSMDIITDFGAGDHIDVSGLGTFHFHGTDANKNAGDLTFKTFDSVMGAEKALGVDIDGHAGATASGPVTVVYGNTDGGSADFAIVLLNHNGVSASDFIYA